MKVVFLLFFFFFTTSCNNIEKDNSLDIDNNVLETNVIDVFFNKNLKEKNYEKIIQQVSRFSWEKNIEYNDYYTQAVQGLLERYNSEIKNQNYEKAYYTVKSLNTLKVKTKEEVDKTYQLLINKEIKQNNTAKALAHYYYADLKNINVNSSQFSQESVASYIDKKKTLKNSNKENWLNGVLTLLVDTGITIEKGISRRSQMLGSAFIIDKRGYAITNYHVIETEVDKEYQGVSTLYAFLPNGNGEKLKASVIGYDKNLDLALIKFNFPVEYVFPLGVEIEDLKVGEQAFALGSPLGLEKTLTLGIISSKNRRGLLSIGHVLQVDTAVNVGNSGGPLLNNQGEVTGIIFAGLGDFEGLNFAIPVKWLISILPQLYKKGPVQYYWLGMALNQSIQGLEVTYVMPYSPAFEAGLRIGDKILSLNNKKLRNIEQYQYEVLLSHNLVSLKFQRKNKIYTSIIMSELKPSKIFEKAFNIDNQENLLELLLGADISFIDKTWQKAVYMINKVFPNSPSESYYFTSGDKLELYKFIYDRKKKIIIMIFYVRKNKEGYLNQPFQIAMREELMNFI